jgi:hypothetical protein
MQHRPGAQALAGRSSSRRGSGYVSLWHKDRGAQAPPGMSYPRSYIETSRMTLRRYPLHGRPDLCNVLQHIAAPNNSMPCSRMHESHLGTR